MGFHSGFSGLVNSRVLFWKWVRVCVLVCLFVVRRGVLCRRWETVRDSVRERGEHIKRGWGLFLKDEYSNWHIYVITLLSMVIPLDLLSCKFQDIEMYKFFCFCLYPVTNLVSLSSPPLLFLPLRGVWNYNNLPRCAFTHLPGKAKPTVKKVATYFWAKHEIWRSLYHLYQWSALKTLLFLFFCSKCIFLKPHTVATSTVQ